jgi:hypothetical protein
LGKLLIWHNYLININRLPNTISLYLNFKFYHLHTQCKKKVKILILYNNVLLLFVILFYNKLIKIIKKKIYLTQLLLQDKYTQKININGDFKSILFVCYYNLLKEIQSMSIPKQKTHLINCIYFYSLNLILKLNYYSRNYFINIIKII